MFLVALYTDLVLAGNADFCLLRHYDVIHLQLDDLTLTAEENKSLKPGTSSRFYRVLIGNREWMRRNGIIIPVTIDAVMKGESSLHWYAYVCLLIA